MVPRMVLLILTTTNLTAAISTPRQSNASIVANRISRAVDTPGVGSLHTQPDICREFFESKAVIKGSKAASPADIFNDLPIGKDFATTGRNYAKEFVFQTPNYPRHYPNNIECIKLISAPSEEHRIYLQFVQPFILEPDSNCAMDFLELRDGAYGFSPLIGRFCSRLPPPETGGIRSSGPHLWLRFRSDNTLPHEGFRAIYHFQKSSDGNQMIQDSPPTILRRRTRLQLNENEQWILSQEFFAKQLEYLSHYERQLPVEGVFDIRSPPGTHLLMHVVHFQVPLAVAWTCQPEELAKQRSVKHCNHRTGSSSASKSDSFTVKPPNLLKVKKYTPSVSDPVSYIDGKQTFVEVYADGFTVSETSPPCRHVHRFCIASSTTGILDSSSSSSSSSSASEKDVEEEQHWRQHLSPTGRLVVRLMVAKPSKVESSENPPARANAEVREEFEPLLDVVSMLPNFTFTLTALSLQKNAVCGANQRVCAEIYCIPNLQWCNGNVNCPLSQDEGDAACNPEKLEVVENIDETETTVLSEKDKAALERAIEERADLEKHAAIIGSISLILVIITAICMFFAIRRKRREANHHEIEIKLPSDMGSPTASKTNHVKAIYHPTAMLPAPGDDFKGAVIEVSGIDNEEDQDDDEVEEEEEDLPLSNSGDPLLGEYSGLQGVNGYTPTTILMPSHRLEGRNRVSPRLTAPHNTNTKFNRYRHAQLAQGDDRALWQSDVNLVGHHASSKAQLIRGDSAKTSTDVPSYRLYQPLPQANHLSATSRSPHQQSHPQPPPPPPPPQQRQAVLVGQRSDSSDIPATAAVSTQEIHVPNCRMLSKALRTRSLATSRFRVYNSRDFIEYETSESISAHSQSASSCTSCTSQSSSSNQHQPPPTTFYNRVPYNVRMKAFRSMPNVNRASRVGECRIGPYEPAMTCGHKDCRDFYRLQALRSEMDKKVAHKRLKIPKPGLFREREIDLSPSYEEEDDDNDEANSGNGVSLPPPNPIAADAYSVHGLSDAISVESSKDNDNSSTDNISPSPVCDDEESEESARDGAFPTTTAALTPPRPPSRVSNSNAIGSSYNQCPAPTSSLSKRLSSPKTRSRVAPGGGSTHPTTPNVLVYEYEA